MRRREQHVYGFLLIFAHKGVNDARGVTLLSNFLYMYICNENEKKFISNEEVIDMFQGNLI